MRSRLCRKPPIEPRTGVQSAKGKGSMLTDPPTACGGAAQARVVDDHGHAVGRKVDVQLNPICALPEGDFESGQSIFRSFSTSPSVCDVQRWPDQSLPCPALIPGMNCEPVPVSLHRSSRHQEFNIDWRDTRRIGAADITAPRGRQAVPLQRVGVGLALPSTFDSPPALAERSGDGKPSPYRACCGNK
jgi:hypothetical protein